MKKILNQGVIRGKDQNKVFVESANTPRLSAGDAEDTYGLDRGRGNAYIEFDIETEQVQWRKNPLTRAREGFIAGSVLLKHRDPTAQYNF